MNQQDTYSIEAKLLSEGIYRKYGYDFRGYAQAHIRRRIRNRLLLSGFIDSSQLQTRVRKDDASSRFLQGLSVTDIRPEKKHFPAIILQSNQHIR